MTLVLIAAVLVPPGTLPFPPDGAFSDAVISHWPNAYFLRESVWKYGQWPLWNPSRMLGQPFAANPLSKVWYPPQWLVLLIPPTVHLTVMLYVHLAWLALGMIAWGRAERLRPPTGAFAALAWGLNPKLMAHLGAGHLDIVYALSWVPWLLWAVRCIVEKPSPRRGVMLGAVAALLALADLRVAFFMLPLAAVYGLASGRVGSSSQRRVWRDAALGSAIFLLLTAVQAVPLLALSPHLTRAWITPDEAAVYSLPPRYLLGMVFADVGGFHEWMTYLGLPVIGLAIYGTFQAFGDKVWRVDICAWVSLSILALLWALGNNGPLFMPIAERVPFVSWFRVPSRAWFAVVLSLTVLSAWGLNALLEKGFGRWGRLVSLAVALAGLILAVGGLLGNGSPENMIGAGGALLGTCVGMWMAGGGLAGKSRGGEKAAIAGVGILFLTLTISLVWVDATLVEGRSLVVINERDETLIAGLGDTCTLVYSPTFALIGPAAARAGVSTLHGVDPFQLQWSAEMIARAAGVKLTGYSIVAPPFPSGESDPAWALHGVRPDEDLLAALGVQWVASEFLLDGGELRLQARPGGTYLYRVTDGTPMFIQVNAADEPLKPVAGCRPTVCGTAPNRRSIDLTGPLLVSDPAILIMPQTWAPGWQAWVDGEPAPVRRVVGAFIGVELPSDGVHMVLATYRPAADFVGMGITGVTVLGLAVWGILRKLRRIADA